MGSYAKESIGPHQNVEPDNVTSVEWFIWNATMAVIFAAVGVEEISTMLMVKEHEERNTKKSYW